MQKNHLYEGFRFKKRHPCGICKKKFSTTKQVQDHQITHTTEKPYKCSYQNCSKSYNNSGSRSKHIAKYHKSNSEDQCVAFSEEGSETKDKF